MRPSPDSFLIFVCDRYADGNAHADTPLSIPLIIFPTAPQNEVAKLFFRPGSEQLDPQSETPLLKPILAHLRWIFENDLSGG